MPAHLFKSWFGQFLSPWGLLILCCILLSVGSAQANETQGRSYVVLVGNNAPPDAQRGQLATLRYADDDVIRVYYYFKRFATQVHLLTVPDEASQRRYPDIASVAQVPSMANLQRVVASLSLQIERDKAKGHTPVVYLYFSGHGVKNEQGIPGLVLADGKLTRDKLYQKVIEAMDAEYTHLFVDACYAEGIVGSRGMFDQEESATQVMLTPEEHRVSSLPVASRVPGLGIFVSSSANRQSHEWSKLESGVFTHVVLSGLSGLADINNDGRIAYSELYAFTLAANRGVKKSLARVQVVVAPPKRNQNVPIVDISNVADAAFVTGDLSSMGHFYVELEDGSRFLDGNLDGIQSTRFWLPANRMIFFYSKHGEAAVRLSKNEVRKMGTLQFRDEALRQKGAVESALDQGLFLSSYGPEYYKGIIDNSSLISVSFDNVQPESVILSKYASQSGDSGQSRHHYRHQKVWAQSSLALAALFTGAAVRFGVLSLKARDNFFEASEESIGEKHNSNYTRYGRAAWISGVIAAFGVTAGILLWPRRKSSSPSPIVIGPDLTGGVHLNYLKKF
ncbi:MAG: hypothetical protein JXX14_01755 [Deltaproteobacteria bacterium]|nr:hypothetical protein [Deltaproteobacteria bacterium]